MTALLPELGKTPTAVRSLEEGLSEKLGPENDAVSRAEAEIADLATPTAIGAWRRDPDTSAGGTYSS